MPSKSSTDATSCSSTPLATAQLTSRPPSADYKAKLAISGFRSSLSRTTPGCRTMMRRRAHRFASLRPSGAMTSFPAMGRTATFKLGCLTPHTMSKRSDRVCRSSTFTSLESTPRRLTVWARSLVPSRRGRWWRGGLSRAGNRPKRLERTLQSRTKVAPRPLCRWDKA